MKDLAVQVPEMIASSLKAQLTFLREDIELCHTFADLSNTRFEMGLRESARQARSKAEAGYATIARLVSQLEESSHREELYHQLDNLRVALDQIAEIELPPGEACTGSSETDTAANTRI